MGQGALDYIGTKGGLDINGIIDDYYVYAGEKVTAGDFVEFVKVRNGSMQKQSDINLFYNMQITTIHSCLLEYNKVFLGFLANGYFRAEILTIQDGSIDKGTVYSIVESGLSHVNIEKVSDNQVAVSFVSNSEAMASIAYVSGTTISFGATKIIGVGTSSYPDAYPSLAHLSGAYLIMTWNRNATANNTTNTDYGVRACVLTVSGNKDLSKGTTLKIRNGTNTYLSACGANATTAIVAYRSANNSHLTMNVLQRSGTTITTGSEYELNTNVYVQYVDSCLVSTNTILIVCGSSSPGSDDRSYGIIVIPSGTSATKGSNTTFNTNKYVLHVGATTVKNNVALVTYYIGGDILGIAFVAVISGTSITYGENYTFRSAIELESTSPCVINLDPETVLLSYSSTLQMNAQGQLFSLNGTTISDTIEIPVYETRVRRTITAPYNAIVKTNGSGDTKASIYKPYTRDWTEVVPLTEYIASDGTKVTADSSYSGTPPTRVFDNNTSLGWATPNLEGYVMIEYQYPKKITKMFTYLISESGYANVFSSVTVQGSNNGEIWTDMCTILQPQTALTEIPLNNIDYYKYYRLYLVNLTTSSSKHIVVREWQLIEREV